MLSIVRRSTKSKVFHHVALECLPKSLLHSTRTVRANDEPPTLNKLGETIKSAVLNMTPAPIQKIVKNGTVKSEETTFTGEATNWNQAIKEAQSLVEEDKRIIDPATLLGDDLKEMKNNIAKLLGSANPFLNTVARHYFSGEGKHVRPLLVLLIAQATSIAEKKESIRMKDFKSIDTPISHGLENITEHNSFDRKMHYTPSVTDQGCTILPTQRRLAEITEIIHTASLLHDDVIDASMTRRSLPSANASFGNKMAILGGDFLLGRASLALARLRNAECTELMVTSIANLIEGEFMQLKNTKEEDGKVKKLGTFEHYMEKTYMKTGSLIAQSCKASAVLGGTTKEVADIAYDFGRNLGLAFQVKYFFVAHWLHTHSYFFLSAVPCSLWMICWILQ